MSVRAILGGLLVVAALAGCGVSGAPAPGVGAERECGRDGGIWRDGVCSMTGAEGGY